MDNGRSRDGDKTLLYGGVFFLSFLLPSYVQENRERNPGHCVATQSEGNWEEEKFLIVQLATHPHPHTLMYDSGKIFSVLLFCVSPPIRHL